MDNAPACSPETMNHVKNDMMNMESNSLFGEKDGNIPCTLTAMNIPPVMGRADAAFNSAAFLLHHCPADLDPMDLHLYLTDVHIRLKDASAQLETVWYCTQRGKFVVPGLKPYYMFVQYICEYVETLLRFVHTRYSFPREHDWQLFPDKLLDICAEGRQISEECDLKLRTYIVSCLGECQSMILNMRDQLVSGFSEVGKTRYQKAFESFTEYYKTTDHFKL